MFVVFDFFLLWKQPIGSNFTRFSQKLIDSEELNILYCAYIYKHIYKNWFLCIITYQENDDFTVYFFFYLWKGTKSNDNIFIQTINFAYKLIMIIMNILFLRFQFFFKLALCEWEFPYFHQKKFTKIIEDLFNLTDKFWLSSSPSTTKQVIWGKENIENNFQAYTIS